MAPTIGVRPPKFIFATEDGVIAGWNPAVDLTHAILVKDDPATGAVYKGIALSAGGTGEQALRDRLPQRPDRCVGQHFIPVTTLASGRLYRSGIPAGFAPFGIQAINGNIYVTYAKQVAGSDDEVQGQGLGFVDVFDPNGVLSRSQRRAS